MIWLCFAAVAAVIILAGSKLSVYADVLAEKFNLSHSTVGILLVSMVTTLPELSTTLGAVAKVGNPNLALGNNLGSVLFNLLIIAICDVVFRKGGILRLAHKSILKHAVSAVVILAVMLLALLFPIPIRNHFGLGSVVVIVMYLFIFFKTHQDGAEDVDVLPEDRSESSMTKSGAVIGFAVSALVVVASGVALAMIGDRLAQQYAFLSGSFVGTLFLAIATSLPELTVGISSVRMGAYDLMLGNIMGANMLNVLVIALADIVYWKAPLRFPAQFGDTPAGAEQLDWGQLLSGLGGMAATGVIMVGLYIGKGRDKKPKTRFGWASVVIFLIYVSCLSALFFGWI